MDDKIVEVMTRGACCGDACKHPADCGAYFEGNGVVAPRMLTALRAAGYEIVPLEKLALYIAGEDYDAIEAAKEDIRAMISAAREG